MQLKFLSGSLLATLALAAPVPPEHGKPHHQPFPHRVPTVEEAAVEARTLVKRESLANLATIVQEGENAGIPESFMEYYADCGDVDGSLTLLALTISSSYRNIAAGSPASLSIRVGDHPFVEHVDPHYPGGIPPSPAGSPRISLRGKFVHINTTDDEETSLRLTQCFTKRHPDARFWLPGNKIHDSQWVKFEVEGLYFLGGFGDRAYIGEIPVELYKSSAPFVDDGKHPSPHGKHHRFHPAPEGPHDDDEEEESTLFGSLWEKINGFFNPKSEQPSPLIVQNTNQIGDNSEQVISVHKFDTPIRGPKIDLDREYTEEELYEAHHRKHPKKKHAGKHRKYTKEEIHALHHSEENSGKYTKEEIHKMHHKEYTEEELMNIHHPNMDISKEN